MPEADPDPENPKIALTPVLRSALLLDDSMNPDAKPMLTAMFCPRFSGATLFALLLDRHPQITCNGETFPAIPRDVTCACGSVQIDCKYYRSAAEHMLEADGRSWNYELFRRVPRYSRIGPLQTLPARYSTHSSVHAVRRLLLRLNPSWRRRESEFLKAHTSFILNSLEVTGSFVYVDGTKSFRRIALLAATGRFDVRAVHLVRDSRGFCHSCRKNNNTAPPDGARLWLKWIKRADRFHADFPDIPFHTVRYEDLCRDTTETLNSVFRFLGLNDHPDILGVDTEQHVLGNRMRLKFKNEIRESLSWQSVLSRSDVEAITEITRLGLNRFGYV